MHFVTQNQNICMFLFILALEDTFIVAFDICTSFHTKKTLEFFIAHFGCVQRSARGPLIRYNFGLLRLSHSQVMRWSNVHFFSYLGGYEERAKKKLENADKKGNISELFIIAFSLMLIQFLICAQVVRYLHKRPLTPQVYKTAIGSAWAVKQSE